MGDAAQADDAEILTHETFVLELEQRMLKGESRTQRVMFAKRCGIDDLTYTRAQAYILRMWAHATRDGKLQIERRNDLRAKYEFAYNKFVEIAADAELDDRYEDARRAMESARKTLDSLVKLDGLEVGVEEGPAMGGPQSRITNAARTSVLDLVNKMKVLAGGAPTVLSPRSTRKQLPLGVVDPDDPDED